MKGLQTEVAVETLSMGLSFGDRIMVLGSCFADSVGRRLCDAGFDAMVNPFGTLYNPVSVSNAVSRMASGVPFGREDCVEMGAGAGLVCSFSHHTAFARESEEAFLEVANNSLSRASAFWSSCNKVIVTLGTSWCFRNRSTGETVANCLKRPSSEFERYKLEASETAALTGRMADRYPDKEFIFTVSPVRHLADGAHGNAVSKASLLLAVDEVCSRRPGRCCYFPSYEILMDELRDYRFYADDMVHPSSMAEDYIFTRLMDAALQDGERSTLEANLKAFRQSRHDPSWREKRNL